MKSKSIVGLIALLIGIVIFVFTTSFSQSQPKHYVIKLYSGNNVVATWEALDWGTFDGQSLTFNVGDRHTPKRVKITGTFSVEEFE